MIPKEDYNHNLMQEIDGGMMGCFASLCFDSIVCFSRQFFLISLLSFSHWYSHMLICHIYWSHLQINHTNPTPKSYQTLVLSNHTNPTFPHATCSNPTLLHTANYICKLHSKRMKTNIVKRKESDDKACKQEL